MFHLYYQQIGEQAIKDIEETGRKRSKILKDCDSGKPVIFKNCKTMSEAWKAVEECRKEYEDQMREYLISNPQDEENKLLPSWNDLAVVENIAQAVQHDEARFTMPTEYVARMSYLIYYSKKEACYFFISRRRV